MKKVLFTLLFLVSVILSYSQSEKIFLIDLGVSSKSILTKSINNQVVSAYLNKLKSALQESGNVVIDVNSNYVLLSDITILDKKVSNASVLPISILNFELTLSLISREDNKLFNTISFSNEYTTNTESEGLRMFINDLYFDRNKLTDFLDQGRKTVSDYYSHNCSDIINTIKKYQTINQYEKALAMCSYVSGDVPCFNEVDTIANAIYTTICYQMDYSTFQSAQILINQEKYEAAIDTLKKISTNSQFYELALNASEKVSAFILTKRQINEKGELVEKQIQLTETEISLQKEKNSLQEGINKVNTEIAKMKTDADKVIKSEDLITKREIRLKEIDAKVRMQQINKEEKELEINRQIKKDEIDFKRKQAENDLLVQKRRDNLLQDYFMKQLLSQPTQFTIIR